MRAQDFQGVQALPGAARKASAPTRMACPFGPRKMGKIHFPVFTPDGTRLVGFMVTPPEIAGNGQAARRPLLPTMPSSRLRGVLCAVDREAATFDKAAGKRLGVDIDHCLIWTGMDVRTRSGEALGYCADAAFNPQNGCGGELRPYPPAHTASMLLGNVEMPAR